MAGAYEGPVDPDSAASLAGEAFEQTSLLMQQAAAQARQASVSAASAAASAADAKAAQSAFGVTYRWNGTTVQFRTPDGVFGPGADLRGPAGGIGKTPTLHIGSVLEGVPAVEISNLDPENPVLDFTLRRGAAAWTPVLATVEDGERLLFQIADWSGGEGQKPAAGLYISPAGYVADRSSATDFRGVPGEVQAAGSISAGQLPVWVDGVTLTGGPALSTLGAGLVSAASEAAAKALLKLAVADIAGAAPAASPQLTGAPTAPTAPLGTNSTQIATMAAIANAVADLVNSAPGALNTLKELADAIGDDPNYAATVTNALAARLTKASNLSDLLDKVAARANLGVAIGSQVQAWDADLDSIAALGTTAFGRGLLTQSSVATLKTLLAYAAGDISGLGGAAVRNVGTTAGTVAAGDDSRFAASFTRGQIAAAALGDPLNFF